MTATIVNTFKENGKIHVDVRYTDVGIDITEPIYLSSNDLTSFQKLVDARKTQIANLYTFADTLTAGSTISAPPADAVPSTQQANKTQFQLDWMRWQQVKKAIDAGLLTGSETQVTAFKTKLSNEFTQVITDATTAGSTTAQAWLIALNLL